MLVILHPSLIVRLVIYVIVHLFIIDSNGHYWYIHAEHGSSFLLINTYATYYNYNTPVIWMDFHSILYSKFNCLIFFIFALTYIHLFFWHHSGTIIWHHSGIVLTSSLFGIIAVCHCHLSWSFGIVSASFWHCRFRLSRQPLKTTITTTIRDSNNKGQQQGDSNNGKQQRTTTTENNNGKQQRTPTRDAKQQRS